MSFSGFGGACRGGVWGFEGARLLLRAPPGRLWADRASRQRRAAQATVAAVVRDTGVLVVGSLAWYGIQVGPLGI